MPTNVIPTKKAFVLDNKKAYDFFTKKGNTSSDAIYRVKKLKKHNALKKES